MTQSPVDTVRRLVAAINAGNLDAAVALYEPSGVLLSLEGAPARGTAELRAALGGFIAMKPKLQSQAERVFESGGIALYLSRWGLQGTDPGGKPTALAGEATDVLGGRAGGNRLMPIA